MLIQVKLVNSCLLFLTARTVIGTNHWQSDLRQLTWEIQDMMKNWDETTHVELDGKREQTADLDWNNLKQSYDQILTLDRTTVRDLKETPSKRQHIEPHKCLCLFIVNMCSIQSYLINIRML